MYVLQSHVCFCKFEFLRATVVRVAAIGSRGSIPGEPPVAKAIRLGYCKDTHQTFKRSDEFSNCKLIHPVKFPDLNTAR